VERPKYRGVPNLPDIESRSGVREAVKEIHGYLQGTVQARDKFDREVAAELSPLYGEADYAPGELADDAQALVTITVPSAIPGYVTEVAYDQSLQGLSATGYVDSLDTVKVLLRNGTGGGITLLAGRFRAYVWPRILSE
jgi:hypothetical protein